MKMKGILITASNYSTMRDELISSAGKGFEFNSHMEKMTRLGFIFTV